MQGLNEGADVLSLMRFPNGHSEIQSNRSFFDSRKGNQEMLMKQFDGREMEPPQRQKWKLA